MIDTGTTATGTSVGVHLGASQKRTLAAVGLGNLIEWFDFSVYATFAVYIADNYFKHDNPATALLSALAVFGVGFVARPFGGLLFGWVTDQFGRKSAMMLTIGLMPLASLVIAITPSYEAIGVAASAILVLSRLVQGISQGGETPASFAFLGEIAPARRRGLWSSLIYVSGTAGVLLGVVVGVVLNATLTTDQMGSFGWRIPFVFGAVLGLCTIFMRRNMAETEVFAHNETAQTKHRPSILRNAIQYRRELGTVVGLTVGFTTSYYALLINIPTYANVTLGFDRGATLWASAIGSICLIISLPFWGRLSDSIGRKPVLLTGYGAILVLYMPGLWLTRQGVAGLIVALVFISVLMGAVASIFPAVLAELLPTRIRGTGIGFPYGLAVALFGGTAPYIQQWAAGLQGFDFFPAYVIALVLVSFAVVTTIPETRGKALLD